MIRFARWSSAVVLGLFIVAAPQGCVKGQGSSGSPDMIYHNGKIVTANESFDVEQALAVTEGRIVAVGSDDAIRALAGGGTEFVDLQGRTVLPGFHDCHAKLNFGRAESDWHLSFRDVEDLEQLRLRLREAAARVPEGDWIEARLSETFFPEHLLPTTQDLDDVTPNHPVALTRGHVWVVNSVALERAGITASTEDPPGGVIDRDEAGRPNGILRENPAQRLVGQLLPPTPEVDDPTAERNLIRHLEMFLQVGITSANIASFQIGHPFRRVQRLYDRKGGELPFLALQPRVRPGYDRFDDLREAVDVTLGELDGLSWRTGFGTDRVQIAAIKMSVDGGFTGHAAYVLEPYPDGRSGDIRIPTDALYEVSRWAHERDWQLGIHAIGDGGVELAVDVLDRVVNETPRNDHRHYLHHLSVTPPEETLRKMAESGIGVCSQPNFVYDLAPFYSTSLSGERLARNNPQRTLLDRGIRVGYGSDHRPYGPIVAIWAAVAREGRDGEIYGPEEALTVEEAIRLHTVESAYLYRQDAVRGTLEVGKYADMVVLTDDILSVPKERIREIGIETTIINGNIVYSTSEPRVARWDDGRWWLAGSTEYHWLR